MPEKKQPEEAMKKDRASSAKEKPSRIYRSSSNRVISGVCGGLGEHLGIDPIIVRIVWAAAVFFGGVGLLAYILAWVIIPGNSDPSAAPQAGSRAPNTNLVWGTILLVVGFLFLFKEMHWFDHYPLRHYWHWGRWGMWDFRFDLLLPTLLITVGAVYLFNVLKNKNRAEKTTSEKQTKGETMEQKLTRSASDRMVAGVGGGLASYFNIDPSLVRIGFVFLTLASGILVGVIAYIVMMVVIPEETAVEGPAAPAAEQESKPAPKRPAKKPKTPPKKA